MDVLVDIYNKGYFKPNMVNNAKVRVFGKIYQQLNILDASSNF